MVYIIKNIMEDLSKIVETLAANNQKLRVAVTKTSAQGEEVQKLLLI